MAWVRLDDGYPEHPKVDRVGYAAAWLNVCAWAYCARNLTDGFVPNDRVDRLSTVPRPRQQVARLVEAKLWEVTDGGYLIHDFLDYNPSREQVANDRTNNARRAHEWRESRRTNGRTNAVRTGAPYPAPVNVSEDLTKSSSSSSRGGVGGKRSAEARNGAVLKQAAAAAAKVGLISKTSDG